MKAQQAWFLSLAALALALPARSFAADTEQEELAAHLSEDAAALLDDLLGPGRAKVFIKVEGERSEIQTQSESLAPTKNSPTATLFPGYAASPYLSRTQQYMQRDLQQSTRLGGFAIKRLDVSLLLDEGLSETQVGAIRKVLSDMLRVDTNRGDTLVVLRASLYPAWRRLLMTPDIWKTLISQVGLLFGILLLCLGGYLMVMRLAGGLAEAAAARRPVGEGAPAAPPREIPAPAGALAGPPSLLELGQAGEPGTYSLEPAQPRFNYLTAKPPQEVARLIQSEPPEDVALLFGWLADTNPELGSRMFSFLPAAFQLDVSKTMVKLKRTDPERISLLDQRLRSQVELSLQGSNKLGVLLSRMAAEERAPLMEDLAAADAEGSREVRESLLTFEDLAALKVEDLRRLVVAVPLPVWAQGLRGADKAFSDRVTELFPPGMRPMLKEAMEAPQPKEKVLEARSKVLSQALALAGQGQLTLKPEAPSEVL